MPHETTCPECGVGLNVEDAYRDWRVRCPECRHVFVPAPDPHARRSPRDEEPDDEQLLADAELAVAGPASWLRVLGWLGIVFGSLSFVGYTLLGVVALNNPGQAQQMLNAPNREEMAGNIVGGWIGSILTVVGGAATAVGAGRMARLENRGWGIAAAVLTMVPCTSCCCLIGLPIGVWALAVLNRPDVRDAFLIAANEHE